MYIKKLIIIIIINWINIKLLDLFSEVKILIVVLCFFIVVFIVVICNVLLIVFKISD